MEDARHVEVVIVRAGLAGLRCARGVPALPAEGMAALPRQLAAELTGVIVPATKGVVTTWWAAPDTPTTDLLHVDVRPSPTGPLVNAAVVSAAAPSYAPPGRHVVQGSALLGPARETSEAEMRRPAGELLGSSTAGWEVVARHEVPDALPAQPAPYSEARPVGVGDLHVCGDHRDTGSIQGALASGQRAADAVLRAMGTSR